MPYSANHELPPSIRHVLPEHAQDIYRAAFNNAWRQHANDPLADESSMHRIAWSAVKHQYVKSGGRWVSKRAGATIRLPVEPDEW